MKLVYASTVHKTNIGQPKILHALTQQSVGIILI